MKVQIKLINSLGEFLSDVEDFDDDEFLDLISFVKSSQEMNYISMMINGNLTVFRDGVVNNSIIQIIEIDE